MKSNVQGSTVGSSSRRSLRGVLPLLLALTFLYNPFFVAASSQVSPSVSHLPSYRADLAAAEFLKFKSDVKIDVEFVAGQDLAVLVLPVPGFDGSATYAKSGHEPVAHQVLSVANIWFRPPPVA